MREHYLSGWTNNDVTIEDCFNAWNHMVETNNTDDFDILMKAVAYQAYIINGNFGRSLN